MKKSSLKRIAKLEKKIENLKGLEFLDKNNKLLAFKNKYNLVFDNNYSKILREQKCK